MSKVITIEQKQSVLNTFNANPSGCFIGVQGYENSFGEVANYTLQSGVNYGNIKDKSIEKLKELKEGKAEQSVHVKCNVWKNPDGSITNRKGKDRTFETYENDYSFDCEDFQNACDEILNGLTNPRESSQTFDKEAKGLYSIDGETLYIRDCLKVTKTVVKEGEYAQSATLPFNALKDAIKGLLPVSNYRTFKLENFESISINGNVII